MSNNYFGRILQIISDEGPIQTRDIASRLQIKYKTNVDKTEINSLLYGQLHEFVIRDKDENGYPVWRPKGTSFEPSTGLELMFYEKLLSQNIINKSNSQLDYPVTNSRNSKTYHLDIAVILENKKLNIEIDGFEHIRADARLSIQKQLKQNKKLKEIQIDWMDNDNSYADFSGIDSTQVFKWLLDNRDWCIKYHEELLWGRDITRNIYLIETGWQIIRFWNFEIKDDMSQCLELIQSLI